MATSDYFNRALFHERSSAVDECFEGSTVVFEERCLHAPIEVRVQPCGDTCGAETKEHHKDSNKTVDSWKEKEALDSTGTFGTSEQYFSRQFGRIVAMHQACLPFVRNELNARQRQASVGDRRATIVFHPHVSYLIQPQPQLPIGSKSLQQPQPFQAVQSLKYIRLPPLTLRVSFAKLNTIFACSISGSGALTVVC